MGLEEGDREGTDGERFGFTERIFPDRGGEFWAQAFTFSDDCHRFKDERGKYILAEPFHN